ncbi:MerR family transcriptional regulator [Micrococcus luteus]|uniref:MerR family transcriptional regulator n=1 Tax=Micrococcus luteus TaxID=1270 RepID=UPI00387A74C6
MRISALSEATGVPVPTLKFYLREGLLHPGEATSRTRAEYDATHVQRVHLVRALREIGGLEVGAVGRLLRTLEDPELTRLGAMAAAQEALPPLTAPSVERQDVAEQEAAPHPSRTHDLRLEQAWYVDPGDPLLAQLDAALDACATAGLDLDHARLGRYAQTMRAVAVEDLASVPDDPAAAMRQVVLGTVLLDPVLALLRRLAQQDVANRPSGAPRRGHPS